MLAAMPYLLLPTARLHYQVEGTGPPVIFLHAGIADARMWEADCAALSGRFTTVRYDLRSRGGSSDATGDYAHHEDLAALLDHLAIERAAVVGLSMGGSVAVDFALAYPERVSTLVAVGAPVRGFEWSDEMEEADAFADEPLDRGDVPEAIERNLALWVVGPGRSLDSVRPEVVALARRMLVDNLARPAAPARVPDFDAFATIDELLCPALFVCGSHDVPDIRRAAEEMSERVERARLVEIEGAGHLVNLEQPAAFRDVVARHLVVGGG